MITAKKCFLVIARIVTVLIILGFYALWRRFMGYVMEAQVFREVLSSTALIVFLLSIISWRWIWGYFVLISIPALAYGIIGLTYGSVDVNAIVALKNTNPGETLEFIKNGYSLF